MSWCAGQTVRSSSFRSGRRRIVKVDDADPVTIVEETRKRRGGRPVAGGADGRLAAAMDGQVAAVAVRKGERVEAGATLVVLEAMKMEMRLVAPFAGRVGEISCSTGDVVERGRVLIVLEPEPATSGAT
jgi:3-methylcrotonyl-CoA carboxylase alpha subunit